MNSPLKYSYQNNILNNQNINNFRISDILFKTSKNNNKIISSNIDKNIQGKNTKKYNLDETLKNSELYKYNRTQRKEAIKILYKMKYLLKKRNYYIYLDSSTIYNKMIINNILENKFSIIKERYIEMLYETEPKEFIINYIPRNRVYYYLKYLIVTYDKFQLQYPTYLKDINVYNIMSQYLLYKQKLINRTSENNNYIYIHKRIKKFFSKRKPIKERILSTSLSRSESKEENHYINLIENSQDSLYKLESLAEKIDKNIKRKNKEVKYTRARTIKHNDILLLKFPSIEKPQRVPRQLLYEISNKKIMRSLKRKGTEIKMNENPIYLEKVIEKDNHRKRIRKKSMLNISNKIHDLKKLIFLSEVGNNKRVFDVMKKGFFYLEEKSNNKKDNEKLRKNLKLIKNEAENRLIEKIKTLSKAKKKFSYNNYYNGGNYKLYKNLKNIIKNLNNSLNEYRFYNKKDDYNNNKRKQYYEKKVIPALFSNKMDSLLNNQNLNRKNDNNNQKRKTHLIGSTSPNQKTYNTSSELFCKKLDKFNSSLTKKNINSNLIHPFYNTDRKNDYYNVIMIDKPDDNSKKLSNKLERIESSIYQFLKTNKKNNKIPLFKYKLNFINKINLAESNDYSKFNKFKKINAFITKTNYKNKFSKKKEGSKNKNSKEIYNTYSDNSNGDFCSIKDKYNSSIKNKRYHTLSNNNRKDLKIKGIKIKFSHDLIKKIKK